MAHKKTQWRVFSTLCLTVIFMGGGCTNKQTQTVKIQSTAATSQRAGILVANRPTFSNIPVYREATGLVWVPLEEAAMSMDLDLHNEGDSFFMGMTDPVFSLKMNQTEAVVNEKPIELPQAPKIFDQKPYVTTQALSTLIGTPVRWKELYSQVVITPVDDSSLPERQHASGAEQPGASSKVEASSISAASVNQSSLINFAKTFLGTPYKFASGPYEATGTFDCSSFVQHVYNHYGVRLPRSSRSQSQVGTKVTADNLQPGDLMFFYTAGRFASNRIVGHVGIYAGNGQIVHTFGSPGVTVTDFSANWRRRFLFAKRVS